MCVYTYVVCVCANVYSMYMYVQMCIYANECKWCICLCIPPYGVGWGREHETRYPYVCVYLYVYIYIYIYIHIYIYTYIVTMGQKPFLFTAKYWYSWVVPKYGRKSIIPSVYSPIHMQFIGLTRIRMIHSGLEKHVKKHVNNHGYVATIYIHNIYIYIYIYYFFYISWL